MPKPATAAKIGDNNPPARIEIMKDRYPQLWERLKTWKASYAKVKDLQPVTIEDCAKLDKVFADARDLANDADSIRAKEKEPSLQEGREIDGVFNDTFRDFLGVKKEKPGPALELTNRAASRRLEIARREQAEADRKADALAKEAARLDEQAKAQEARGNVKQADVTSAKADAVADAAENLKVQATQDVAVTSRTNVGGVSASVSAERVCTAVDKSKLDWSKVGQFVKDADAIAAVNAYLKFNKTADVAGASIVEQAKSRVR